MLKPFTANRLNVLPVIFFLFFFSILAYTRLTAQVAIQSFDTKSNSASTVHALTSVPAGALLVLTTAAGSSQTNCTVTSSPSLTWARKIEATAASSGDAEIYTAVFTAGGSISVTSNWGNQHQASVCYVVTGQETTLAGTTGFANSQEYPSVTVTTTRTNSILFCVTSDWNGVSGSVRAYRNTAVEKFYYLLVDNFTGYHYTKDAPTTVAYTMGLTAPSMLKTSVNGGGTAVLEIRGPADTQAPSAPVLSSTGQTGSQITLSWTASTDNIGVTGYDIYVGGVLNGTTTNTTYTVTGLSPSTQYSIYAKAKDAADNGTNSNTIVLSTLSADFWSVTGNAGTDPATHFLGTTDAQRLVIKTNNTEKATIDASGNVGIGTAAPTHKLEVNGSLKNNGESTFGNGTSFGWVMTGVNSYDQLLSYRAAGASVSALNGPLYLNGKAGNDVHVNRYIKINSDNDASDGLILTPYSINTAAVNGTRDLVIGANQVNAMKIFQSGNIAIQTGGTYTDAGYKLDVNGSLRSMADATINNMTVGIGAGGVQYNTALGKNALALNTPTGLYNTAVGYEALAANTIGTINTAVGYASMISNTIGNYNTAVGANALLYNINGSSNTAVGYVALSSNTSGGLNTAVGHNSMAGNTTGSYNSAFGRNALSSASIASYNTAVGFGSQNFTTDGGGNTSIGAQSLYSNTAGSLNTANGYFALYSNTSGVQNIATGPNSLYSNATGNHNTSIGFDALRNITAANGNIAMGYFAGSTLTSGNNNIFIGYSAQPNISTTSSNQLNIGGWIYGNNGDIGIGVSAPSARLHSNGTLRFEGLTNNDALSRVLATDASGNVSWRDAATLGTGGGYWIASGNNIANNNTGVVTIGTSTPPATAPTDANLKLAVYGNISTKKVRVTQTVWADYVFSPQYKLPTLKEVEEFIQKNKHLADVPSAAEVEKDGLDLGGNQAVLLKKIEELTLYLIEINKKVEKLADENMQLKKKLEGTNK